MNPAAVTDCTELSLRAETYAHGGFGTASTVLCCRRSKMLRLELTETLTEHESWQLRGRKKKAVADRSSGRPLVYLSSTPGSADPGRNKGMSTSKHPPPVHFSPKLIPEIQIKHVTFRWTHPCQLSVRISMEEEGKKKRHLESEVHSDSCGLKTAASPNCNSAPIQIYCCTNLITTKTLV